MKIKKLGIFDSGLGGYSVYHELMNSGPKIEYVLYSDQKNAPYGNKETKEIIAYVQEAMAWFKKNEIYHVLLACNTASAVALKTIQEENPEMTIWGIIDLTLNQIKEDDASIAVVSTLATYNSHAYQKAWKQKENIKEYPLVHLVDYIENLADKTVINDYIKNESLKMEETKYLILACTHYPLVKHQFANNFDAEIIDSLIAIKQHVYEFACLDCNENYKSRIYTSGDPKNMEKQIKELFNLNEKVRSL